MTIGTLILGSAALLLTAYCSAACLRLRTATEFVLAAYLVAFSEVVVVELVLSPGRWLSRTNLLYALYIVWFAVLLVWTALGTPRPPPFRPALEAARDSLRDPVVAVLAAVLAGAFCYVAVLVLATAPNDYDALWYHLARAAFWKQQHAVSYVTDPNDGRLNAFPPNAEIANSFTMILGQSERFVGFVQLATLAATMVAVGGLARRVGLTARQAVFAALVFATFPVVILQASTALNDVVFASFLTCCAYFLFTYAWTSMALAAVALGLALGTKLTALLALPVLALVAAFVHPRRRWLGIVAAGTAGIALGAYWYVYNLARTGRLNGRFAEAAHSTEQHGNTYSVTGVVAHTLRLAIDAVDPSGSVGRDRFLYLVAAAVILLLGLRLGRGHLSARKTAWILVAAGLAALPLAFRAVQHELLRGYQKLWVSLDERRLAFLGFDKHLTRASPFQSWYGALGQMLVLATLVLAWRGVRRRTLPPVAAVLALAPAVWLLLQAITTFYSPWDGRYLLFAVALGAALFGLVLPLRPLAWAAAAIAVTSLALSLVHYDEKPSGVSVLGGAAPRSVWDSSRAEVLSRSLSPDETAIVATLEQRARKGDTIALAIGRENVSYPYFGSRLDRRVVFGTDARTLDGAAWLVLAPGTTATLPSGWSRVTTGDGGWRLYRHV